MHPLWLQLVPLLVMLVVAATIDLRSRRIPNWLTVSLLLTGLIQSFLHTGFTTPAASGLGVLAGLFPPLLLFLLGAMGGGDVKLMAAVGAWLGPWAVLWVFLFAAIAGMLIVLVQAGHAGRLATLFRNSAMVAMNVGHVRQLGIEHVKATGQDCRSVDKPLPYAVPVLISTLLVIVTMVTWR